MDCVLSRLAAICGGLLKSHKQQVHDAAVREWKDFRHGLSIGVLGNNHEEKYRPDFANWSGNIETKNKLIFPKNDQDIKEQIMKAKRAKRVVTVAGAGHSASPGVCDNGEPAVVLCLASYSMATDLKTPIPDMTVDTTSCTLHVNAGWHLDKVMSELGEKYPDYIFEAQTAGRIFAMGGLINACTHGGCMKAGLVADTVTSLRVINAAGEACTITDEEELRFYRMSYGAFGVVTHLTIKLRKITELELEIKEETFQMTEEWFAEWFKDKISWDGPQLFQQLFFDMYNMKIYYCAWKESGQQRTQKDYRRIISNRGGSRGLGGAPIVPLLDEVLDVFDINYRSVKKFAGNFVKVSCEVPKLAWRLNEKGENDAFWVSSTPPMPASHWTVSMVPIDAPSTTNIFKAVKVAHDKFKEVYAESDAHEFRPDVALEARFVWSSDSYFAPNFTEQRHEQLFFAVEQPTLASNLYVTLQQVMDEEDEYSKTLNREFTQYFADLEKGWEAIDPRTKPHLCKLFGFAPHPDDKEYYEPFNTQKIQGVLSADRKAKIRAKLEEKDPEGVFKNKFVTALVG